MLDRYSKAVLSLGGVLLLVIALRYYSILNGLPYSDMSDEVFSVAETLRLAASRSLRVSPDSMYSSMYYNLLALVYGAIFFVGKIIGRFGNQYDFALRYMTDPWLFYFTARLISFLSGVGALWFVGKSCRLMTNSTLGGVLGALLLGLSSTHLWMSRVGKVDALMVFFTAAYLYQVVKILKLGSGWRTCAAAGILFGFAVASKMNAVLLAPALPMALLFREGKAPTRQEILAIVKLSLIFSVVAVVFFLIGNPQFLVSPKESWYLTTMQGSANSTIIFTAGGAPVRWWWVFESLVTQEGAIGVAIIVSFGYCAWRALSSRRADLLLLLLFIAGYIAYVGSWIRASLHYLMPAYPLFAIVAAVMFIDAGMGAKSRSPRQIVTILSIVVVITLGLWKNAAPLMTQPRQATRIAAKEWMEHNILTKSLISYDDYAADPPFFSPDVYLKAGTKTSFEKYVPEPLRKKLLEYADTHTSYRSIRLRQYLDTPQFPTTWSTDFRKVQEQDSIIAHHYRLSFDSLAGLYAKNVEFIIVSSGYYGQFYNTTYPRDNPLYEFNQRGLAFYKKLFADNRYYIKVAEFAPSNKLSGPRITLFRRNSTSDKDVTR